MSGWTRLGWSARAGWLFAALCPLVTAQAEASCPDPCPFHGTYDGANCLVAPAPADARPLIGDDNHFYYEPLTAASEADCPADDWDGTRCRFGTNPPESVPFVLDHRFYLLSACNPVYLWTTWVDGETATGTLSGRTKLGKIHLKWRVDPTVLPPDEIDSIAICIRPIWAIEDVFKRPGKILQAWAERFFASDRDSCPNLLLAKILDGWADETFLHNLPSGREFRVQARARPVEAAVEDLWIGREIVVAITR